MSDYCLLDREIKFSIAPGPGDDKDNQFDTDETVRDLIAHNAALRKVCANR